MTQHFGAQVVGGTGAAAMWSLVEQLVVAGWSQVQSSDGTTAGAGQVTGGGSSTHGLGNSKAYVVMEMPLQNAVTRQVCIQRVASNLVWYIKVSRSGAFVASMTPATVAPAASDEKIICGTGPDSGPTGGALFASDGAGYVFAGMADDSLNGFVLQSYKQSDGSVNGAFILDPTVGLTGDLDPFVWLAPVTFPLTGRFVSAGTGLNGYVGGSFAMFPLASVLTWINVAAGVMSVDLTPHVFPNNMPNANPVTALIDNLPISWVRDITQGAPQGFKGVSSYLQWGGATASGRTIENGTSTGSLIRIGDVYLPWNNVTPA